MPINYDVEYPKLQKKFQEVQAEVERLQEALDKFRFGSGDISDWADETFACKICGGEIPYGHQKECVISQLKAKSELLRDKVAFVVNYMPMDDTPYKALCEALEKSDE